MAHWPAVRTLASLRWLWILALVCILGVAQAAEPVPAQGMVERVRVEGTRRIEEAAVLAAIGLRRGEELSPEKVRRDLKAVYRTGFFDDVSFELIELVDTGTVEVVVQVREKPAIRELKIEGEKKIDEDDIREVIDVRAFSVYNDAEIKRNVRAIRDLYIEKGFYLVDIDVEREAIGEDQVDVTLRIQENRKVLIQRVEFTGNDHIQASKIKRFLQLKEGGFVPWLTSSGTYDGSMLDTDRQIVAQVFLEEGYVDVQVDPAKVYLSPDKRFIYISYAVVEGEQYRLGELDAFGDFEETEGLTREAVLQVVAGRRVADVQEQQWRAATDRSARLRIEGKGPSLETGDIYRQSVTYAVRGAIESLYQDQGYAFVNIVPRTDTDPDNRVVNLTFQIEKGEKLRIGRINITGNDPTFDKVVRREIQINEGEIYRGSLIKASKARLERLGFFDEANYITPRGDGPDVLDLNWQVSEQPTGSFSLGAGYSNLESLVVTANVSKNNFLGLGYNMSLAINWSRLRRQFQVSFLDPFFLDSRWLLNINGYSVSQNFFSQFNQSNTFTSFGGVNEYQRGGSFGVGRYLDPRDDIQLRMDYTFEDVGLTNIDAFRQRMFGGELYRNGLTSTLGLTLSLDKRNNRIFPTQGVFSSVSSALSGGFRLGDDKLLSMLGGDFNFVENRFNVRVYQPLLKDDDRFVFRANVTLGQVLSTDGRIIPFIHRYRAGGINSVRGYNWFSLGPTIRASTNDDPIRADDELIVGGTQTWVNNFEIESQIVRQAGISGVVFFDAGNAFGDPWGEGNLSITGLRSAYGLGVRWRSPIGPLRFEYGFPIKPRENERKSVFDFSIGSFF
ncbi:MAG: outer membrane protein insertion porin family [Myxococcota bacterium]